MKQNGTRLEYKTPREITNMDRKMSSKDCSEVKQVAISTLQEKKISCKTAKFCQQNHMNILASLVNNQSFYSIADFFARFTTLNFTSRGKIQRFIASDQSKMISLQDSAAVYEVPPLLKESRFVSPAASRLALSPAV